VNLIETTIIGTISAIVGGACGLAHTGTLYGGFVAGEASPSGAGDVAGNRRSTNKELTELRNEL
jgi:hypothetical protein